MYLGLDLGTSELKAILLTPDHRIVAQAQASLTISQPQALWSEQAPQDWAAALFAVCDQLAAEHPQVMADVRAIGLAGQMHGAVLLDAADAVLRPAILWNDGRSHAQCAELERDVPTASRIAGNHAMPGFTAPKLLWVREHEPQLFRQVKTVLLPKDYLRLLLTGEKATDCSDASGTFWLDIAARAWSAPLLDACGLDARHMPRLVEGNMPAGTLLPELARRWGMRPGIIIAGGGGDNAASAVGMGVVAPGQGFVSLGTSGVIFIVSDGYRPNPSAAVHAFCHALPGIWHQMSVMLAAASGLRWITQLTGRKNEAVLLAEVEALSAAERLAAPIFLPYLRGERTPHNDPLAKGAFIGLTQSHNAADLAYAVIEGVAFGLRDGLTALTGPNHAAGPLAMVGGGARSLFWSQLLADILEVPLILTEGRTAGAALGAARLAWLATGGTIGEVCQTPAELGRCIPNPQQSAALRPRYDRFRAAYPALRPLS
jgi:xylulokinase